MHEMHTEVFSMKTSKEKITSAMDSYARRHGEYHQGIGRIDWKDGMKPFSNEDEAYDYISHNLFGDYEQVAVPFLKTENIEDQVKGHPRLEASYRKVQEMAEKATKAWSEYEDLNNAFHFKDAKSELVGCKNCGSKIARKYLKSNKCPVCGHDLRPRSLLDRIEAKKEKSREYRKQESQLRKAFEKKLKSEEMWLVKIEYHV